MKGSLFLTILILLLSRVSQPLELQNTGSVVGTVTWEGKPIAGVTVTLSDWKMPPEPRTGKTDADGRFRIDDLKSGKWTARWEAQNYSEIYPIRTGEGVLERIPTVVQVSEGSEVSLDLKMEAHSFLIGQVVRANGTATANEIVWAVTSIGPRAGYIACSLGTPTHCDKTGRFRMEIPRGQCFVGVYHSSGEFFPITHLGLKGLKETLVHFRLTKPAVVSGRVMDVNGNPVPDADLKITPEFNPNEYPDVYPKAPEPKAFHFEIPTSPSPYLKLPMKVSELKTNKDGRFKLELASGLGIQITAYHGGMAPCYGETSTMRFNPGEHRAGIQIRLTSEYP